MTFKNLLFLLIASSVIGLYSCGDGGVVTVISSTDVPEPSSGDGSLLIGQTDAVAIITSYFITRENGMFNVTAEVDDAGNTGTLTFTVTAATGTYIFDAGNNTTTPVRQTRSGGADNLSSTGANASITIEIVSIDETNKAVTWTIAGTLQGETTDIEVGYGAKFNGSAFLDAASKAQSTFTFGVQGVDTITSGDSLLLVESYTDGQGTSTSTLAPGGLTCDNGPANIMSITGQIFSSFQPTFPTGFLNIRLTELPGDADISGTYTLYEGISPPDCKYATIEAGETLSDQLTMTSGTLTITLPATGPRRIVGTFTGMGSQTGGAAANASGSFTIYY